MGQKVNPIGMRLQVNRTWDSRWYADTKEYGDLLLEDLRMREFIKKDCAQAGVSKVIIERPHKKCRVTIHTARPGVIIGKKGADIENLSDDTKSLIKYMYKKAEELKIEKPVITSGMRGPASQASVMYTNWTNQGGKNGGNKYKCWSSSS